MSASKWWGASEKIGELTKLSSRLDRLFPKTKMMANAEPFTVRVRGVMVLESKDWWPKKSNDIMIVTTSQFAGEPPVQRLHFMQDNAPLGWQGSFFNSVVLALKAFNAEKRRLTLRIQVYDLDRFGSGLVESVAKASQSVAVAFPHLAPYSAAVSFGVPALLKLIDNLDNHDRIIDERITLELSKPEAGRNLLQPGYLVCFGMPIEGDLFLSHKLRVIRNDGSNEFNECSYAVLGIERQFQASRDWEIDQKVAKLVAELNGKGQSGKAALDFLRETLDAYDRFQRLEEARALRKKTKLTRPEETLLQELEKDEALKPYLTP